MCLLAFGFKIVGDKFSGFRMKREYAADTTRLVLTKKKKLCICNRVTVKFATFWGIDTGSEHRHELKDFLRAGDKCEVRNKKPMSNSMAQCIIAHLTVRRKRCGTARRHGIHEVKRDLVHSNK